MDALSAYIEASYHITLSVCIVALLLAGQFDNHLWRLIVIGLYCIVSLQVLPQFSVPALPWWGILLVSYQLMHIPHLRRRQKKKGCVFVTGADSGMGQATVVHLAKTNDASKNGACYDCIFAGAYDAKKALTTLEQLCAKNGADFSKIKVVPLDVTSDKSVAAAAALVKKEMPSDSIGLSSLVNYHGIGSNGPVAYMPVAMYLQQHDVNYIGNVRMAQNFLPLLKAASSKGHRGRLIFTGTGGGPCSPCPSLLSAYMSSKFACEAFAQSLSMELIMTGTPIDVAVLNPGFVKPTALIEEGKKLSDRMWKQCEDRLGSTVAKDEYGPMLDHFLKYAAAVPGAHVSEVCKAAEDALTAFRPRSSYKIGIDSKLAPIVGMLPTGVRTKISLHGIYGVLSPAGSVKGYAV